MPSPYNITNIPAPRVEFIDPRTGLMAREWYRFFFNLFNLTGAGTTDTSLADLQVGPPGVNDLLGELGITYDQAQLASMMAQYEQATRNIQNQLDTAPSPPQLGTLAAENADNVRLIGFSTNPSPAVPDPAPTGTLYWDGNSTLGLQMNQNVLARIGQAQFVYVKASSAITKGQLCKHTGSVGASGVITAAPTSTSMTDTAQIIGVAAQSIALNDFGFVQTAGDVRGFDLTGSSVGEVWADGDPLYYNPSFVGSFTKTKPTAPNLKTYIGEIINAGSGGSGSMNIHIVYGSSLGGTDSNVQFGVLADKDLIQYDSALQYWKNVASSSIAIGTATNLSGGAAGSLPYQSGASTTTFLSIGTAGQYAKVNAGATAPEWASPGALTKTDDTNVTLTLGGSASTALLNAASITVGWTGTLAVSRGGTGTGTAFTAGSVVFAGASGVYSQNNAQFFWDNTNARLGVGTTSPNVKTEISGSDAIVSFRVNTANAGVSVSNYSEIQLSDLGSVRTYWRNLRDGSGATIFSGNNHIRYALLGTEQMRLSGTGLGIGTTSPSQKLHVNGISRFTDPTAGRDVLLEPSTSGTVHRFYSTNTSAGYAFENSTTEFMRVTSGGNLGVGTASPVNKLQINGSLGRNAPVTKTGDFTLADTENWLICNGTGTITVTLPAASSWTGREVMIKTIAAFTVVSASSNVVPLAGGAAGTAILAATAGAWATLVSDGTNWIIMQA